MMMYYTKKYALKEKEINVKNTIEDYWDRYPESKIQTRCFYLEEDLMDEVTVPINVREPKKYYVDMLSKAWSIGDYIIIFASRKSQEELQDIHTWLNKHGIKEKL
jgi:hypothetical protein